MHTPITQEMIAIMQAFDEMDDCKVQEITYHDRTMGSLQIRVDIGPVGVMTFSRDRSQIIMEMVWGFGEYRVQDVWEVLKLPPIPETESLLEAIQYVLHSIEESKTFLHEQLYPFRNRNMKKKLKAQQKEKIKQFFASTKE